MHTLITILFPGNNTYICLYKWSALDYLPMAVKAEENNYFSLKTSELKQNEIRSMNTLFLITQR